MKLSKSAILAALVAGAAVFGAGGVRASDAAVHWAYEGHEGPENWGGLAPEYEACGKGAMQSPVDLAQANVGADIKVDIAYKPVELSILNSGHTVQFNVGNGSTITTHGETFDLLQVHFHTPSEHVYNGKAYPLEAHFVHKSADGALAVIGLFLVEGKANPALEPVWAHLPGEKTDSVSHAGVTVDPRAILPKTPMFYRYMGSLTTPPCSEGVNWFVIDSTVEASAEQIAAIHAIMGSNARPAQSLRNRLVVEPAK